MKFSLDFIKELVDIDVSAKELARKFTLAGLEVGSVEKTGADFSFEAEVTSNRPDLLSILGLSYEAAALLGKKVSLQKDNSINILKVKEESINADILDGAGCSFYLGVMLREIKVEPSPAWLKNRLISCGVNPVNNIVDITNYCMLKWGQPLHAFDSSLIKDRIIVRRAKEKESLLCIDEKERRLGRESLVIADTRKVLALAGIIGGKETEIRTGTRSVFLEAALFCPLSIRRARRSLGIDTDSSYRFERNVNPAYLEKAVSQAVRMMIELAGAKVKGVTKRGKLPAGKKLYIKFSNDRLNQIAGAKISQKESFRILKSLGCVIKKAKTGVKILPPLFRTDLHIEEDLFEEVVRIWGYDRINPEIPAFPRVTKEKARMYDFKNRIRDKLICLGFKEIVTFSILNRQNPLFKEEGQNPIHIKNPLRADEDLLRPALYPGMVESMRYNVFRKQHMLEFFEIASAYSRKGKSFSEIPKVCLGMHTDKKEDFFLFKAKIDRFIEEFGLKPLSWRNGQARNFSNFCKLEDGIWAGVLKKSLCERLGLDKVFIAEADMKTLFRKKGKPVYCKITGYPWIDRDISLGIKKDAEFKRIDELIKEKARGLLKEYQVIDIYKGKNIKEGYTGLTVRISYQHRERTLYSEEVDKVHFSLRDALAKEESVFLR